MNLLLLLFLIMETIRSYEGLKEDDENITTFV